MLIDTYKPINIKQFGKVSQQKGKWHNGKTLGYHLMLFVEKGSFKMLIDKKTVLCSAGDFIVIPKGTYYKPLDSAGTCYYFFQLEVYSPDTCEMPPSKVICTKYTKQLLLPENNVPEYSYNFNYYKMFCSPLINVETVTHCLDNIPVRKIIQRLAALNIESNYKNILLAESFLREILIIISSELNENRFSKTLNDILEYINLNYHEPITLGTLAKKFRLSESYIARIFKTKLGTTTSDYINLVRVQAACNLLLNTKQKIGDIAYKCGYSNPYYFSRVFRNFYGITPGEFRKNERIINP